MLNMLQEQIGPRQVNGFRPDLIRADVAFKAAADKIRREILEQLRSGERKAGEIASAFDVSWPAISRHLRVLTKAGLVQERKQGRERFYSLNRDHIRDVFGSWVAAFDLMWNENLEALRQHVESQTKTGGTE